MLVGLGASFTGGLGLDLVIYFSSKLKWEFTGIYWKLLGNLPECGVIFLVLLGLKKYSWEPRRYLFVTVARFTEQKFILKGRAFQSD
jgi:hypothetical protein